MKFLFRTVALLVFANTAFAVDISVVGLFPNKAVLVVDGKSPKPTRSEVPSPTALRCCRWINPPRRST